MPADNQSSRMDVHPPAVWCSLLPLDVDGWSDGVSSSELSLADSDMFLNSLCIRFSPRLASFSFCFSRSRISRSLSCNLKAPIPRGIPDRVGHSWPALKRNEWLCSQWRGED